jgi:hypothetical protein
MDILCLLRTAARAALAISLGVGFAATSFAYDDGVFGLSGKEGTYCRNCHVGGTVPMVEFQGPTVMTPGAIATFRFVVSSQSETQIAAGLDVASGSNDGRLGVVEGQGTRLQFGEVTHNEPRNDIENDAVFEFTWQAPANEGTYTLFGAGCSVNLDGTTSGDAAARTTYEIAVGVNIPTPTPTQPVATLTATATEGSATPCVGDCGNDGQVTVDELITGVNIALGVVLPSACPQFDANGDGTVTVDEILQAVNNALNGCPA